MTTMTEEVAKLTGSLKFNVDLRGLRRFELGMRNASKHMQQFQNQYSKLAAQVARGLKLKIDTSALDNAKSKLDTAIKRQQRAEAALANQRRSTFNNEISQQKLKFAQSQAQDQTRAASAAAQSLRARTAAAAIRSQQSRTESASLQSQRAAAIVAAKASAAQARAAGLSASQLASQNALTASLARQAKLQAILQRTAAATQRASNAYLASQGRLQRLQQQMNHAQQQAHLRARDHAARMAAAQQTAADRTTSANQRAARLQMAQERHAAWQARQNAPRPAPGAGLNGMMAFGALSFGLAGLAAAVSKIGARIEERKKNVVDAERFEAAFVPLGKTKETRDSWKKTYTDLSTDSGAEISNETAEDFRTFVAMQQAFGKKTDEIVKEYKLRQQAFTISGLTKDSAREVNRQFNQVATDGLGDKSDWNVISERMPALVPYVGRAFGREEKIADPKKAMAAFNKRMKKGGGVKLEWINEAMETMVGEQQDVFSNKKKTVAFAQTLGDNQAFLNQVNTNLTPELNAVMRDNIEAHRELNTALQPAAALFRDLDAAMTKAQSAMIRFSIGLNLDGTKKTEQEQMQDRMSTQDLPLSTGMVGTPDYSNIDSGRRRQTGPIGEFWNWALGIKDKAKNVGPVLGEPVLPDINLGSQTFNSHSDKNLNYQAMASRMPTLFDTLSSMQGLVGDTSQMHQAVQTTQTINTPITVEGANVNVTINGSATEKDRNDMMDFINNSMREQQLRVPGIAKDAIRDALGQVRSQQAERM
ncbi:hypothetical protein OX90_09475 [Pseudomonas coronafaciens pv. porri]|uniref:Uncharacterized protein n=1 Tax=Pseudomonas coronafaciens pv. porri TaxID=83964 RepID=A0ABR5JQR2_9PSED|nr:hypothetical protein [Pseudomonas coronafaciens]KOP59854.1 hypothetical protein OX90_09475 [Pseudomonas coronafaciens pv. porri]